MVSKILYISIPILLYAALFLGDEERPRHVEMAYKLRSEAAHNISRERNLELIGTGGGMIDTVNCLSLSFQLHHEVEQEEAREVVVYATEELLRVVNSDEKIRPYLCHYPFTASDVEIWLWIKRPDKSDVSEGEIRFILSSDNKVIYKTKNSHQESSQDHSAYIYREPYDEALAKVRAGQVGED